MNSHRLDPTALVAGLLFIAIGFGVFADQQYESVDLGVVAGGSIVLGGIALIAVLVSHSIMERKADKALSEISDPQSEDADQAAGSK